MGPTRNDPVLLSAAVKRHLSRYPFWTDNAHAGLVSDIGESGGQAVQEAFDFACGQEDLWLHVGYRDAFREVQARLTEHYPSWDVDAIRIIAGMAAYEWK